MDGSAKKTKRTHTDTADPVTPTTTAAAATATATTAVPMASFASTDLTGTELNAIDLLELYKLQMRAVPELIELFQTVPELSDFSLQGQSRANEGSGKLNFFSKVKSIFSSGPAPAVAAIASKRTSTHETTHTLPSAITAHTADTNNDDGQFTAGMPLESLPFKQVGQLRIPIFMDAVFEFLRAENRLQTVGIFRKGGVTRRRKTVLQCLMNGLPLPEGEDAPTALDVADVLKEFLRELPERLINSALSPIFVAISIMQDYKTDDDTLRALQLCHLAIPTREHRDCLQALVIFLADVVAQQSHNKMDQMAVAKCIVPNLFHLEDLPENDIALFYERAAKLLARLIQQPQRAFTVPHLSPASAALAPLTLPLKINGGTPKNKRQRVNSAHENTPPMSNSPKTPRTPKTPTTPKTPLSRLTRGFNSGSKRTPTSQSKLRNSTTTPVGATSQTPLASSSRPRVAAGPATPSASRTVATRSSKFPFPFGIGAFGAPDSLLMPRGVKSSTFSAFASPLKSLVSTSGAAAAGTPGRPTFNVNFSNGSDRPSFR